MISFESFMVVIPSGILNEEDAAAIAKHHRVCIKAFYYYKYATIIQWVAARIAGSTLAAAAS